MNPESPYQNREIDEKFDDIKLSLDRIEAQTIKTNGAVAETKKDLAKLDLNYKQWRAYLTGALTVLTFFIAVILIPIIGSIIQNGNRV
jgi:hypothetical protein